MGMLVGTAEEFWEEADIAEMDVFIMNCCY
jgi:hypothetical protein